MDALSKFYKELSSLASSTEELTISQAREVVRKINEFLYCSDPSNGKTYALGNMYEYISDFHKYWEKHHKEILNCQIDEEKCEQVADVLFDIYRKTNGKAFNRVYDTCGLTPEQICQVRMLTANQDFRGSRNFSELAQKYREDPSIFDPESIEEDPRGFLKSLGFTGLSQNDKRENYAKTIARFVRDCNTTPYGILECFKNDVYAIREALINRIGAGYGNKKADMFIRDMVVLGVWKNVVGFDRINVASDINTIKVALRTGIIKTEIPLVSSFLDIFCHQYSYIDDMNAEAWRRVWEIWTKKHKGEALMSPCLIDYFVYNVIGIQFCKENLTIFECSKYKHHFPWHTGMNKTCQICYQNGEKRIPARIFEKLMPCSSPEGEVAILNSDFVRNLPEDEKLHQCPFADICGDNRKLMAPKSISILGQTGWATAYTQKNNGGGGLMA